MRTSAQLLVPWGSEHPIGRANPPLLSAVAALFTHFVLLRAPITTDVSSWHATIGMWHIGVVLAAGLGACYCARRGHGERVMTS
jgi:hypothetical protein